MVSGSLYTSLCIMAKSIFLWKLIGSVPKNEHVQRCCHFCRCFPWKECCSLCKGRESCRRSNAVLKWFWGCEVKHSEPGKWQNGICFSAAVILSSAAFNCAGSHFLPHSVLFWYEVVSSAASHPCVFLFCQQFSPWIFSLRSSVSVSSCVLVVSSGYPVGQADRVVG